MVADLADRSDGYSLWAVQMMSLFEKKMSLSFASIFLLCFSSFLYRFHLFYKMCELFTDPWTSFNFGFPFPNFFENCFKCVKFSHLCDWSNFVKLSKLQTFFQILVSIFQPMFFFIFCESCFKLQAFMDLNKLLELGINA